jgi:hypothetical protein
MAGLAGVRVGFESGPCSLCCDVRVARQSHLERRRPVACHVDVDVLAARAMGITIEQVGRGLPGRARGTWCRDRPGPDLRTTLVKERDLLKLELLAGRSHRGEHEPVLIVRGWACWCCAHWGLDVQGAPHVRGWACWCCAHWGLDVQGAPHARGRTYPSARRCARRELCALRWSSA